MKGFCLTQEVFFINKSLFILEVIEINKRNIIFNSYEVK